MTLPTNKQEKALVATEDVVTEQVAHYLLLLQRQGKILLFTHVANENGGNKYQAFRNKRLGLSPGVPDMLIVYPDKLLFLELKRAKGGKVSLEQADWITSLSMVGKPVYARIGHGFDEAKAIIDEYCGELLKQVQGGGSL